MKKYLNALLIGIALSGAYQKGLAQAPKPVACDDPMVKMKADDIKQGYLRQNMVVFQEATLLMQSLEPTPVAIKLTQGKTYQLIFVGSQSANKMTLEIFDGQDKRVDEKVVKGSEKYIIYTFVPSKSDVYLVMLTQRRGGRELCGSFTVMMPNPGPKAKPKQATPVKAPAKSPPANNPRYRPNIDKPATQPIKKQ